MIRNYSAAAQEFERALTADPHSKPVRKKLVICYVQLGRIREAVGVFHRLIDEDIEFIVNTDPEADDCPCPELIFEGENGVRRPGDLKTSSAALGMLWLYCDIQRSLEYFEQASLADPDDEQLLSIIQKLREFIVLTNRDITTHGIHQ